MNLGLIALVVGVIAVTYVLVNARRERVAAVYERGDKLRSVVTAIFVVIVAWTFVRSGDLILVVLAVLLIAFATVYVLVEQPHKEIP